MNTGFTLTTLSTRSMMAELLRRGEIDAICGTARRGEFENTWLLKKCKPDKDHQEPYYTVGAARAFGLWEADTIEQALDKLAEITKGEQNAYQSEKGPH